MRRYAAAGFDLLPAIGAVGIPVLDAAPDAAARVEEAGTDGLALAETIVRDVRGAGYGTDLEVSLASGSRLLVFEDRVERRDRSDQVRQSVAGADITDDEDQDDDDDDAGPGPAAR